MDRTFKDYLLRVYPPTNVRRDAYEDYYKLGWDNLDFEGVMIVSNKIIDILKEENMTYTDAYAMLGFVHKELQYRSERINL